LVAQEILAGFCSRNVIGDINQDCYVNLFDIAVIANHWLYSGYDDFKIPQDLNSDRSVDVLDLIEMSGQWLQTGTNLSGDIALYPERDGIVNLLDFLFLAKKWQEKY
jgi:predicted transcriptional regulator